MTEQRTDDELVMICNTIASRAARMMIGEGAPIGMAVDTMLTFGTAQACLADGALKTLELLDLMKARVEAGEFADLEKPPTGPRH